MDKETMKKAAVIMMEIWAAAEEYPEIMPKIAGVIPSDVDPEELRECFWAASQTLIEHI